MDQRSVRDILAGKTYFIRTFGCQMNQHDSERVSGLLDSYGCLMALDPEHADIVVFMTCCVREAADTRLYGQCNSCKSLPPSPSGKRVVAVGGCIAQRDGEGLLTNVDNVNVIFGTHSIAHVAELIAEAFLDGKRHIRTNEHEDTDAMSMPWHRETQYHAWVPIMTGCNNFCTYCIVPYVRGRERSRSIDNIVAEIEAAVKDGYKEFTLLGQNVNSYGKDFGDKDAFAKLLRRVDIIPGVERIHYMTSHPRDMSEEVIKAVAECEHICENFHMPFQAGSSEILRRMNRGYTKEKYLELVKLVRKYVPDATITTDIIVGFPGETEENFEETLDVVRQVGFTSAYTFIYSKRSGTPAAKMENQVPLAVKKERLNRLMALQNENSLKCHEKLVGQTVEVLAEGPSKQKTVWNGRTRTGVLVLWPIEDKQYEVGQKVNVQIEAAQTWLVKGKAVD